MKLIGIIASAAFIGLCLSWDEYEREDDEYGFEIFPSERRKHGRNDEAWKPDQGEPWQEETEDVLKQGRGTPWKQDQDVWSNDKHAPQRGGRSQRWKGEGQRRGYPSEHEGQQTPENLQYTYKVETAIGSEGHQRSGLKIEATLYFSRQSSSTCLLKLQEPSVSKINGMIEGVGNMGQDTKNFEQVRLQPKQSKVLSLPVKFSCQNGLIKRPMFDEEDEPWSTNLKRGALNLFHINTKYVSGEKMLPKTYYQVYDESVEGECQTDYSFMPVKNSNQLAYNVTKSVNFHNCKERPHVHYDFPSTHDCFNQEGTKSSTSDEHLIQSSSISKYAIFGKINTFQIREAETTSQYIYAPFAGKSSQMIADVNQKLVLMSSNSNQKIEEPKNSHLSESGPLYSLEWDVAQERSIMSGQMDHLKKLNADHEITNIPNKAVILIKEMQKITVDYTSRSKQQNIEEKSTKFLNLIQLLRQANTNDLQQIENELEKDSKSKSSMKQEKEPQVDNVFAQLLGICGTKASIHKLIDLVKKQKISEITAIFSLKQLFNVQIPSESVILEILHLANHFETSGGRNSYFMKQTLWLLSGSLMNSLCSGSLNKFAIEQHHPKSVCSSRLKHQFVQMVATNLQRSHKWEDKLIFTKALANAGLPESLGLLEKLIQNKNRATSWVRNSAIYALRKLAQRKSSYVQGLLMPLVSNSKEPSEIRLSAMKILLESNPDFSIMRQLASIASQNHNEQVSNAIISALNTISNSTRICDHPLIHKARLASQSVHRRDKPKCGESSSLDWVSLFSSMSHKRSLDFEFVSSFGNQSSKSNEIPNHQSLSLSSLWFGLYQKNLLTLGLVSTDPDKTWHKAYRSLLDNNFKLQLAGKKGNHLHQMWSHGFRPSSHDEDEESEYEYDSDDNNEGYKDSYFESFKALIYTQIKDQNVGFLPIDKNLMRRFLSKMNTNLQRLENAIRKGIEFDVTTATLLRDTLIKIPTSAGLPLALSIKSPVILNINGKFQLAEKLSQMNKAQIHIQSNLETNVIIDFQIWSPIVNHGFKVENLAKFNVPLSGAVEVDLNRNSRNVRLLMSPSQSTKDILIAEIKPTTYSNKWIDYIKDFQSVDEKSISINPTDIVRKCYEEVFTASHICIKSNKKIPLLLNSIKPAYFAISLEPNTIINKEQQLEINISAQGSSSNHQLPYHNENRISNKVHVVVKSGQRRSSLSLVSIVDPSQLATRFQAVLKMQQDNAANQMMCLNSEWVVVDTKQKLLAGDSTFRWGRGSCQSARNYINIKLRSEPKQNQHSSTSSKIRETCTSEKCDLPGMHNAYKVVVNYNVPVEIKNATNKIYQWFRHAVYDKSDVAQIDVENPSNQISAIVTLTQNQPFSANLVIKIPNENVTVSDLSVPTWFIKSSAQCPEDKHERPFEKYTKPDNPNRSTAHEERASRRNKKESGTDNEEEENGRFDEEYQNNEEEDNMDSFQNFDESEQSHIPKREYSQYINVGKLKHENDNGLNEGSTWSQDDKESQYPNEEEEKKEKKKPSWGDWLKEDRKNERSDNNPEKQPIKKFGTEELKYDQDLARSGEFLCRLDQNDKVTTLSKKHYNFPVHKCFTILSKDCSPSRRFIIMVKKLDEKREKSKKELFILLKTHKILVKIVNNVAIANVNDISMELKDGAEMYAPGSTSTKLNKKGSEIIIEMQELGIRVQFDGYNVMIQFSTRAAKVQCGLCGQPNNDNWPDESKPNFEDDLYARYVIKDSGCKQPSKFRGGKQDRYPNEPLPNRRTKPMIDISQMHHGDAFWAQNPMNEDALWKTSAKSDLDEFDQYGNPDEEDHSHSLSHQPSTQPINAHEVIETAYLICISVRTIPKCPHHSHSDIEQKKKIPFICLDKWEQQAKDLRRKALAHEPIPEFKGLKANKFFSVSIPSKCTQF